MGRSGAGSIAMAAALSCVGCATTDSRTGPSHAVGSFEWSDPSRARRVPVVVYGSGGKRRPLAIISNGFGTRNTDYSFLATALVARGYVVVSIQQDLPGDPPMASSGNLAVLRRPAWQTGADTISYVVARMVSEGRSRPGRVVLIGHSNGGDISMLFAAEHPETVSAVFTLDNRRMPMPRTARPRICSVRSSDLPADPGVLPSPDERRSYGIRIGQVQGLRHNDMTDQATPPQRSQVIRYLASCLRGTG